jgi:hypothetical protein
MALRIPLVSVALDFNSISVLSKSPNNWSRTSRAFLSDRTCNVYMYVCYVYLYICFCMCIFIRTCMCISIRICECACTCTFMRICICIPTYIHTYPEHTYLPTYIHKYIHKSLFILVHNHRVPPWHQQCFYTFQNYYVYVFLYVSKLFCICVCWVAYSQKLLHVTSRS